MNRISQNVLAVWVYKPKHTLKSGKRRKMYSSTLRDAFLVPSMILRMKVTSIKMKPVAKEKMKVKI